MAVGLRSADREKVVAILREDRPDWAKIGAIAGVLGVGAEIRGGPDVEDAGRQDPYWPPNFGGVADRQMALCRLSYVGGRLEGLAAVLEIRGGCADRLDDVLEALRADAQGVLNARDVLARPGS